jgi:hypothetical protein
LCWGNPFSHLTMKCNTHTQVDYEKDREWLVWCQNAKRALLDVHTPPLPQEVGRNTPLTTSTLVTFESAQRLSNQLIARLDRIKKPEVQMEDGQHDYTVHDDYQELYNEGLLLASVDSLEGSGEETDMESIWMGASEETVNAQSTCNDNAVQLPTTVSPTVVTVQTVVPGWPKINERKVCWCCSKKRVILKGKN